MRHCTEIIPLMDWSKVRICIYTFSFILVCGYCWIALFYFLILERYWFFNIYVVLIPENILDPLKWQFVAFANCRHGHSGRTQPIPIFPKPVPPELTSVRVAASTRRREQIASARTCYASAQFTEETYSKRDTPRHAQWPLWDANAYRMSVRARTDAEGLFRN